MLARSRVQPLPVEIPRVRSREIKLSMHRGAKLVHCGDAPRFPEVFGSIEMLDWTLTHSDFSYVIRTDKGFILDGRGDSPLQVGEVSITAQFPLLFLPKRQGATTSHRPGLRPVLTFHLPGETRLYHWAEFNKRFYPLT